MPSRRSRDPVALFRVVDHGQPLRSDKVLPVRHIQAVRAGRVAHERAPGLHACVLWAEPARVSWCCDEK